MDYTNLNNKIAYLTLVEQNNKTSGSNDFAGELASTSDKGTSPKSTNAQNRSETSTLYGSASQDSENPTTSSNCAENHSNSAVAASHENDDFPLHTACADGNMNLVQELLDNDANFEMEDDDDTTPLHIACLNGHTSVAQLLHRKGRSC